HELLQQRRRHNHRLPQSPSAFRLSICNGHGLPIKAGRVPGGYSKGAFIMTTNSTTAEDRLTDRGTQGGLTVIQRVAICFAAGVVGGLAVVLFSHVLYALGLSATLGVTAPVSLKSPEIYRPLFWAGLWGIPFGLV